ncbi:mast cell protease 1A-like [Pieris brassicae]|uniref:mast cell protease 1A-like n=1 Tax=Pieris brassicae TaxID=7116 RepID=UPI001E6613AC|nr:mast cell protease 1A-like [Pieris brassicae]
MTIYIHLWTFVSVFKAVKNDMEGFVVGGEYAQIAQYPHSVFLDIYCGDSYICGGSLVTNQLVLTAAHCLSSCQSVRRDHIIIKYGHEVIDRMRTQSVRKFVKHRHYNDDTLVFDIAMVMARNAMQLGRFVKRVALMSKYPKQPSAGYIAGWGVINSEQEESVVLKATVQKFQPNNVCSLLGRLPVGTYCAGPITGRGAPDQGDSGSAFVIQGYIQIGIVSYKNPRYSLVVYTNTTYHYDWILRTAKRLNCN